MPRRISVILALVALASSLLCLHALGDNSIQGSEVPRGINKIEKMDSRVPMADPGGMARGADITSQDVLIASNDRLELYLNEKDLIVKVKDKSNGYVWSSAAPKDKMQSLNFEWQRIATSLLTVEYINPSGSISRSPLKHSNAKKPKISIDKNGFSAEVEFYEAKIALTVRVELTDLGIKVTVPDESIVEKGKNILHKLYIMPFFGAAYRDEFPGYVLIPDGCGALIRFSKPRPYISSYVERIYGPDLGMKRPPVKTSITRQTDKERLTMPVFGVAHGGKQNAFLAVITSGEPYAEINVNPANSIIDYTWVCAAFIYREQYIQPISKTGGSVFTALQPHKNAVNATIEYIFLSGEDADYVGMAKAYRQKLYKEGILTKSTAEGSHIKLLIEALMAEPYKGFIGNRLGVMTRLVDVERWIRELYDEGINSMSVVLWGYEKGGVNGHRLTETAVDPAVGSLKDVKRLSDYLNSNNGELLLKKEIFSGYEHQIDKSKLAYHIDGGVIEKIDATMPMFQRTYYQSMRGVREVLDSLEKYPYFMKNIAFSGLASNLFSDFKRGNVTLRHQIEKQIDEMFKMSSDSLNEIAVYDPNIYAVKYANKIFDVPMQHSQFAFETDMVPFMQIVLSGSKEYYAPPLNFGVNSIDDVLRLIDYGAYPSYVLTEEYSNKLASTNLNYIYSSRYNDWKDYIIATYKMVDNILSKVKGKAITKRTVPENGIVLVEYEDGTTIAINYTDKDWKYNNEIVEGKSARIIGMGVK
ncbi:hypothetical protein JOD02_000401 [Caldicoprobacter guelmensis]|uniref:DUF5696 domain-containing protein n=1 Tax=Caldicoprobacter guelmensis TaxID=1170224 RepID=UPI00195B56FC|nr:hypothetical protein [Caldicoprobacter guelmensis]